MPIGTSEIGTVSIGDSEGAPVATEYPVVLEGTITLTTTVTGDLTLPSDSVQGFRVGGIRIA